MKIYINKRMPGSKPRVDNDREKNRSIVYSVNALKIMFTNVDTLTQSKLQELTLRDDEDAQPIILVVQEVKPKSYSRDIQLSEYNIEGYEMLPLNISNNSTGRGMIIYTKDNVKYFPCELKAKFQEGIL
jgi:hypothetical protein